MKETLTPTMLKLFILQLVCLSGVLSRCYENDEIQCHTADKCVKIRFICDGDNDCGDDSDENQGLCLAWKNNECPTGEAYCRRDDNVSCVSLTSYCNDDTCDGNVDKSLCQILKQGKLEPLNTIDSPRCDESEQIQCQTSEKCIKIRFLCDDDDDCGDESDENEELCNAWKNHECPKGEVRCKEQCVSIAAYCLNHECQENLDRRLCSILSQEKLQPLSEITVSSGGNLDDKERTLTKGEDFLVAANHTFRHEKCPLFFTQVGEECLSLFFIAALTWGEARAFCHILKGDLYVPRNDEEFHNLVHHLKQHQLTSDFWLGGTYSKSKGWVWVNEVPIKLETLHWAIRHSPRCSRREIHLEYREKTLEANEGSCYHYIQMPENQPSGSCVAATYDKFFFMSDENCLLKKSPLCKLAAESNLGSGS